MTDGNAKICFFTCHSNFPLSAILISPPVILISPPVILSEAKNLAS
jgi:hypothetical protein